MKTISFEKKIHAPVEKVWETLWNDDTYRKWTKHFTPDSRYESDWEVGGKTLFLDADRNGMIATITKLDKPYEVIFNHLGEVINGIEGQVYGEGSFEKYMLQESEGITTLTVSIDVLDEYEHDMEEGFTHGLEEVKRLAENK
jgi:Activator of Hsp90 ATPase homolog 1-like protein.